MLKQPAPMVNGQITDQLNLGDRGLAYGDGVFETIRVNNGEPFLLDLHLIRLQLGLQRLAIDLSMALLKSELAAYLEACRSGVLKIIVTRGIGGRGYACETSIEPTRIFSFHALPDYPESYYQNGIDTRLCSTMLSRNQALAGIKHLNRLEQVLARQEYPTSDYPELLMCSSDGLVIEGISSNFFAVRGDQFYTPDLEDAGVHGTMRHWLINWLNESGSKVFVEKIRPDQLTTFDELFFCNSVFGVWPVRTLNGHRFNQIARSQQLQSRIAESWDENNR